MRIGILNDLHLGHTGTGTWHNRLLSEHAEEAVQETVTLLNEKSLDMAIILGDVTNDGTPDQLELAKTILSELAMPWLVLPGNHDREGVRSGLFSKSFGEHVPEMHGQLGGVPSLFLTEYLPPVDYPRTELGRDVINEVVAHLGRQEIDYLLVFSHFPLISQESYASERNASYAKHYLDGEELLDHLDSVVSKKLFCFSAHQHWHRITDSERVFHCMTASMIEYPMEARIVSIEDGSVSVSTIETACPKIAAISLNSAQWVRGREHDRLWRSEQ